MNFNQPINTNLFMNNHSGSTYGHFSIEIHFEKHKFPKILNTIQSTDKKLNCFNTRREHLVHRLWRSWLLILRASHVYMVSGESSWGWHKSTFALWAKKCDSVLRTQSGCAEKLPVKKKNHRLKKKLTRGETSHIFVIYDFYVFA